MSVPLKNLRITPRESDYLDRKTGISGEIFYDRDVDTLRLYSGQSQGGISLAKASLTNVSNADFLAKANSAGVSGGGGNTTVSVGSSVPVSPSSGNLWLNTNTGSLYVYINDGTSSQWIQPSVPFPNLTEYATQQYVTSTVVQAIAAIPPLPPFEFFTAADDSTQRLINNGNTVKFVGAGGVTTSSDADGTITITGSQPIPTPPFEFFTAADDSTQRAISNGELIKFIGAGGVTTSSDADGNITITGGGSTGNITFVTTTIDSTDSSAIIFTPAVIFNSDITVQNELFVDNNIAVTKNVTVSGNLTTSNLIVSGEISSQGSGVPEIVSDNEILLEAGTRVEIVSSPIKLASFSSAARDLLTASNGDMIYNTTTNKFQGRASGAWVDLH